MPVICYYIILIIAHFSSILSMLSTVYTFSWACSGISRKVASISVNIDFITIMLCRSAAFPPLSPLRTVRASFPAYSSDNSKFSSHKTKSALPLLYSKRFPIKFPFGTYVCVCLSASASRSRHSKSGRKDLPHTSLLHVA